MISPRLSAGERLLCYERTLKEFRTHSFGPWLCVVISSICPFRGEMEIWKEFPELATQKPPDKEYGYVWWNPYPEGNTLREKALQEAIRLVKIEIEKDVTLNPSNGPHKDNS